jgi:hypothetical protein
MDNIFIVNPSATTKDLQSALHEKLLHTKALTSCILFAFKELENSTLYDAIWAVDSLIETIYQLKENLENAH